MSDNKVLKSGVFYTISSIAIRAVAIVTTPIYTSMLSTNDYGIANTYNSWIDIFNIITCLCVVYSIGRAKIDYADKFDEYMSALQGLSSTFAAIVLLFVFIFRNYVSRLIQYEVPLVIMLFTYLVIFPSVEYMLQKCRYEYKYKENILISLITCVGSVFFSILFMLLFSEKRYFGKIAGSIITPFLLGLFFYINILRQGKCFYKKEYWKYALKFGIPMIPHAFALVVLAQVDRIMIKDICGNSDVGLYTFGYSFATLLSIFTNAIGQAWLPWFNEQLHAGNKATIKDIQKKLVLLGVFLTLGFITVAPDAIKILSPNAKAYWDAKWVIAPVALGTLMQYFYTNYVNVELFHKKTPVIAVSSIAAAFVNYCLNALVIPRFGYISAAYTTLLSYIFLMLFHYIATRYVIGEKVYDDVYMFIVAAVSIGLGLMLMQFYKSGIMYAVVRYVLFILIFAVVAFINKKDVESLVLYCKKRILKR